MPNNIENVVESHLCCQCGTCRAVCPHKAIEMKESPAGMLAPRVGVGCVNCGKCLEVCPGRGVEVALPENINPFRGEVVDSYVGHACTPDVRTGGQSGGVVSALLLFLLDTGQIDAAVVTSMLEDNSLRATPILAATRGEILSAQGSKYCPAGSNSVLRDVAGSKRIAMVGLPCQMHGLQKLPHALAKDSPAVVYRLGLFCDRTLLYSCIDQMALEAGICLREVRKIEYRSKERTGWPGEVCFRLNSGNRRFFPPSIRFKFKDYFTPPRCRVCFDKTNVFSDLSIGDSWGVSESAKGESVIIARTQKGALLLNAASAAGYLNLRKIDARVVFEGQGIEQRREDFFSYLDAWKRIGGAPPEYRGLTSKPPVLSHTSGGNSYQQRLSLNFRVAAAKTREDVLRGVPRWLIKERFSGIRDKVARKILGGARKPALQTADGTIRVVHFQRKRNPDFFSMESLFDTVRSCLPDDIACSVAESRFLGIGFFKRFYNMAEAAFRQGEVNHITGDVHFLAYFMRPRRTVVTVLDCGCLAEATRLKRFILWLFWYVLPLKLVACVTVISEAMKNELLRHVKLPTDKVRVIPCCISPAFTYSPKQFNSGKPKILLVGTRPNKNLSRIFDAIKGVPCQLEIVGRLSGEDVAKLSLYGFEYAVSVNIPEAAMIEKYRECDMLLFASTYEGFGLPILEANAVGRPVVTSNILSMPEVAGNAACLVDPFDTQAIRDGVLNVVQKAAYREELVRNGLENVKRFSSSRVAGQYAALYREMFRDASVTPKTQAWNS